MEDIETRVTRLEDRVDHIEKEQSDIKEVVKETRKMANSIEIIALEMTHVKDDVKDIKKTVEHHHTENPNKFIFNIKNAILIGIATAILTAILTLILK